MNQIDVRYARLPASSGWLWLKRAYAMFRAFPMVWLLLTAAYLLLVLMLGAVPLIGGKIAMVLKPVFNVGFLAAAWSQERGDPPKISQLFAGFKSNLYALVPLGIIYGLGLSLAVMVSAIFDQGTLAAAVFLDQPLPETYLSSFDGQRAMLATLLCVSPILFGMWFAPAIVVFNDVGTFTALSASLRAALANWRPLLVFGLVLLLVGGVLPTLLENMLILLFDEPGAAIWLIVMMPVWLTLLGTLYISDFVSYRQVFHPDEPIVAREVA